MAKTKELDAKGYPKFGIRDKIAYAAGDLGCNMSFSLKGTVQTFWLVFMMMETGLLSILLLIVQIWDAVNDPIIGTIIDNDKRKYKLGKFRTYVLVGAIGLLVGGAAVFLPFPNADVVTKAILFVLGYIVWDAFYTIANVPYGSMLSVITEDVGERAQLSTWRSIGSMIGNILPMVILPMLIWQKVTYTPGDISFLDKIEIPKESAHLFTPENLFAGLKEGDKVLNPLTGKQIEVLIGNRVFWAALIMGIIGFLSFMLMIKLTTVRVDENTIKTNEPTEKFNIVTSFGKFMKNRPAVGATIAAMGMFLGMNAATTANTIMFATYFNMASLSGVVQMIGFLPMFFFMPFITKIVKKMGKKEASVIGTLVSILGGVIMLIFPLIPVVDNNVIPALVVYLIGLVVYGVGMGVYTCVSWAMMGDAIDYNEWKFGTREEGTVYSLHSFFRKLAQGVGPSLVLLIMGALGYVSAYGTVGQTAAVAHNMCWLVAGLYMFSAIVQFIGLAVVYNLDKKTVEVMNAELQARHALVEGVAVEEVEVGETEGENLVEEGVADTNDEE
ncbi:MAG: MFS transporter [Clostridia bacterium]|nr:MFS transporter [Clostridia bacterium]